MFYHSHFKNARIIIMLFVFFHIGLEAYRAVRHSEKGGAGY